MKMYPTYCSRLTTCLIVPAVSQMVSPRGLSKGGHPLVSPPPPPPSTGGDGSHPNFVENVNYPINCRLSVRALGRPTRLNPTVPRLRLTFSIFGKLVFDFCLACPVAAGAFLPVKMFFLRQQCVCFLLWNVFFFLFTLVC